MFSEAKGKHPQTRSLVPRLSINLTWYFQKHASWNKTKPRLTWIHLRFKNAFAIILKLIWNSRLGANSCDNRRSLFKTPPVNEFSSLVAYPYRFGSDPPVYTGFGIGPNWIGSERVRFKSGPKRVRLADPNGYGSRWSLVNARPRDPLGSVRTRVKRV